MSNEMISVERGLLERACAVRNTANGWALSADAIRELRALLAKPAEQPQGEPVAPIVIEVKDSCVYLLSSPLDPGQYRLYTRPAEQPAPAAVVLPGHVSAGEFGDESMENGWNACIDATKVRNYGAVGDGVTDDSAAFQDALDARSAVVLPDTFLTSYGTEVMKAGEVLDALMAANIDVVADGKARDE